MTGTQSRSERLAIEAEADGYPEHAKMHRLNGENAVVQRFIDWLYDEAGYSICEWQDQRKEVYEPDEDGESWWEYLPEGFYQVHERREQLMARFFGIDLQKLSEEKDAMFRKLLEAQA